MEKGYNKAQCWSRTAQPRLDDKTHNCIYSSPRKVTDGSHQPGCSNHVLNGTQVGQTSLSELLFDLSAGASSKSSLAWLHYMILLPLPI
ncbi:uncharacterized protein MYCFIDRAFT_172930 [Pseudocercospora fijiensis CIRAD86]|uniref:Uncharacterized protein n=1 Tax=Pseudocercospora fijiensis (strain CIRAD86) TaxID=383855 RepID=M3AH20_PSEFD|nr:uncharacterized protein MYCFIDRAFT_172930 [Pseudocercospora fijiensis CIRAD86]EME83861.1 hypothetical protein MYCFIDRAFT_172930 [Pseudocercospora fijiensis CIRAD86]